MASSESSQNPVSTVNSNMGYRLPPFRFPYQSTSIQKLILKHPLFFPSVPAPPIADSLLIKSDQSWKSSFVTHSLNCGTCVTECEDRVSWNRGQTSVFIQLTLQSREWVTKEDFQLWSDCIRSESAMGGHRGEEKRVLISFWIDVDW